MAASSTDEIGVSSEVKNDDGISIRELRYLRRELTIVRFVAKTWQVQKHENTMVLRQSISDILNKTVIIESLIQDVIDKHDDPEYIHPTRDPIESDFDDLIYKYNAAKEHVELLHRPTKRLRRASGENE
jgi:hypothetical protein